VVDERTILEHGAEVQVRPTDATIDVFLKREFKQNGVTLNALFDRGEVKFKGAPELTLAKLEEHIDRMIVNINKESAHPRLADVFFP